MLTVERSPKLRTLQAFQSANLSTNVTYSPAPVPSAVFVPRRIHGIFGFAV
jgi:hypothetical protein